MENFKLPFARAAYDATTEDFLQFLNSTGSPYHSVDSVVSRILKKHAFEKIPCTSGSWTARRGGKYYATRGGSTIFGCRVGRAFNMSTGRVIIAVGHTDSPCLRLSPNADLSADNLSMLGVSLYGGGLWHTWTDRGLAIAGKLVVKANNGGLKEVLVKLDRPIAIVPSLPPHLQTADERSAWKVNKETSFKPLFMSSDYLCADEEASLLIPAKPAAAAEGTTQEEQPPEAKQQTHRLHPALARALAEAAEVEADDIVDFDLCLFDATPARRLGLNEEFIEGGRLDNLVSTYAVFQALCMNGQHPAARASPFVMAECASKTANEASDEDIYVSIAFDHEEVGSVSSNGADSNAVLTWLKAIVRSVVGSAESDESFQALWNPFMERSFLASIDVAHAANPNFADKYQSQHRCFAHRGVVIKSNVNQRYATTAMTSAAILSVGKQFDVPIQKFIVRNDTPCGSTVGPCLSARLGIRTIDIGTPIWAMHSSRECCAATDILHLEILVFGLFSRWGTLQSCSTLIDDA